MAKLAAEASINKYLDEFKLSVDASTDGELQKGAERIIKGRLFGIVDASLMSTWDLAATIPVNPPELIQEVASLLVAGIYYSTKVSEDETLPSAYGQQLYNRGLSLLESIAVGTSKLYDLDPSIVPYTEGDLQSSDFWPNDSTAQKDPLSGQKFRTNMTF